MKNRFELPKVPLAKETAFSRIPGREDSLFVVYIEILRKFLSGNSFPFDSPPGIFGYIIRFSEIQQFLFFSVHISKFSDFWVEWKAP